MNILHSPREVDKYKEAIKKELSTSGHKLQYDKVKKEENWKISEIPLFHYEFYFDIIDIHF